MFPILLSLLYPSSYPLIIPLIPRKPPLSTAVLLADLQALNLFAPALQLCTAHVDHLLQHGGLERSKGDYILGSRVCHLIILDPTRGERKSQ